jgi:hypothetical protein
MAPGSFFCPGLAPRRAAADAGARLAEWQQVIADCDLDKHMTIVGYLKSGHGMGTTRSDRRRHQAEEIR